MKLHVLKPSVNNMAVRVFVRAAKLDFTEDDVYGKTRTTEFLAMNPAHLTPMMEAKGLPKGVLWESCAIMQYLCNKHELTKFYPKAPAKRAMIDSAMFYLIGTLYPLVARATYPSLGFSPICGRSRQQRCHRQNTRPQPRRPPATPSPSRSMSSTSSIWTESLSSAGPSRQSPTFALPPPSNSSPWSITSFRPGPRPTWQQWRNRWAKPMPNPPPTCAATSPM